MKASVAVLAIVFGLAGSGCSRSHTTPPAVKVVNVPQALRRGYACAVTQVIPKGSRWLRDRGPEAVVKVSPNEGRLAAALEMGTRLIELSDGSETQIERAAPVAWSGDSNTLYLMDTGLAFYSLSREGLRREEWLDDAFAAALAGRRLDDFDLSTSGYGLVAISPASRRFVTVVNLEDRSKWTIWPGATSQLPLIRSFTSRPQSQVMIGWDETRNSPAVFVAYQTGSGADPFRIIVENHIQVFDPHGELRYTASVPGREVSFLPHLSSAGVRVLARQGEIRCIHVLNDRSQLSTASECKTDVEWAYLDHHGQPIAQMSFLDAQPHLSNLPSDGSMGLRRLEYVATLPDGAALALESMKARTARLVTITPDELISVKFQEAPIPCLADGAEPDTSQAIDAISKDGLTAHGLLFWPARAVNPKGLIVYLHGGPYSASPRDWLQGLDSEFLRRGYAVVAVNYRGTPGYGSTYLRAGYGAEYSKMVDDAEAIAHRARDLLHMSSDRHTVLHGMSFGGYLAGYAAQEHRAAFDGYIVESGLCDYSVTVDNANGTGRQPLPLAAVSNLDEVLGRILISTPRDAGTAGRNFCERKLASGVRMVILHARNDEQTPYSRMKHFYDIQDPKYVAIVDSDVYGHGFTEQLKVFNPAVFSQLATFVLKSSGANDE